MTEEQLNRREHERYLQRVTDRWPMQRALLGGEIDLDAFARYLGAHSPVAPPTLNRITKVG